MSGSQRERKGQFFSVGHIGTCGSTGSLSVMLWELYHLGFGKNGRRRESDVPRLGWDWPLGFGRKRRRREPDVPRVG